MNMVSENLALSDYNELVKKIRTVTSRFHIVSLNRQLDVCDNLLHESPVIDIAILGQFKAGKSSFINSLTASNVLPVGVIPVTTVITRLRFGPQQRAVVTFFDGTNTEVPLEEIGSLVSESENPGNLKDVDVVDIELPSLACYPGLRLVDTPGLGSVFAYHKEVSENWLPQVGAAILAISADRPLSENDLGLIQDLARYTPRIVILLTKADLLTPEQQDEVVRFFRKTLEHRLGREYPIFLYSTRTDTEAMQNQIRSKLLDVLSVNREQEFTSILGHKTQSLVRQCLSYLDIARETSRKADQDRESLRAQILNEKTGYDRIREEITAIIRDCQRQTRTIIMNHLNKLRKPLTERLTEQLASDMRNWKGNLWKLTRMHEAWMAETIEEEIRAISKSENKHFYGTLNKSHMSLTRYLENFRMMLDDNLHKVLGMRLAGTDWKIDVIEPGRPDIKVSPSFEIHWDLLWFLIPMVIFRGIFERHFLNQIPWEVEVNLSRLATQWEERINAAMDGMRSQALGYIKDEIATIDALLSQSPGTTNELDALISELQGYMTSDTASP